MDVPKYVQIGFIVVLLLVAFAFMQNQQNITISAEKQKQSGVTIESRMSSLDVLVTEQFTLPIEGIVPSSVVRHVIPLEEVKQGCSRQDCIPSVDTPVFIDMKSAKKVIKPSQIGIALSYKGENRFYPFSMLVTKEIVNDVVAGDPLLISYCPLCGTGIVFERTINGEPQEFGVSGMLWQSNLLMYNRAEEKEDINLWSQVLGTAAIGSKAGQKLTMISSDIMKFQTWSEEYPKGSILDTGSQRDPYNGKYFDIAQRFAPNFNQTESLLSPDAYVYGITFSDVYRAYPRIEIPEGEFRDMIGDTEIVIRNQNGRVSFQTTSGENIDDVEGFWFSWVSAHPQTTLWSSK